MTERGLIMGADAGEGIEDIVGVVLGQPVEVKVERVQAGADSGAPFRLRSLVEIPIGGPRG